MEYSFSRESDSFIFFTSVESIPFVRLFVQTISSTPFDCTKNRLKSLHMNVISLTLFVDRMY